MSVSQAPTSVSRASFEIEPRAAARIRGDVWTPPQPHPASALVVCHGFKGFKDWGFFPYLSSELARHTGIRVVSFNFSGSGVGADLETFSEMESFARNTFSLEKADLEAVLAVLQSGQVGEVRVPAARRFGLFGHSRGGATCVLVAAGRPDVDALVTWASIASLDSFEQAYAAQWEREGIVYIHNARTGQDMPLRRDVLDDLRAHRDALDVPAAAARLRAPWLVVHGTDDESVPAENARALVAAADGRPRLEWIEGAGHTMNAAHPFSGTNEALERALALTADHFAAHLA